MAEDDQDRASEIEAEREAEIDSELERVGQNPDQVREGSENLGTQSAESGTPRGESPEAPDEAATSQEDAQELPDDQQTEQWEQSGGDETLAEAVTDEAAEGEVPEAADETDEEADEDETDEAADGDDTDGETPAWAEPGDENLAEELLDDDTGE